MFLFGSSFLRETVTLGNVILLSHPAFVWLYLLNSLCNPFIYCYTNTMFRERCKELLNMKCTSKNSLKAALLGCYIENARITNNKVIKIEISFVVKYM